MTTFAHTENVAALDPQVASNAAGYLTMYKQLDTSLWQVVQVPDGTKHGAKPDGIGNYTNPDGSVANANGTVTPGPQPQPLPPLPTPKTIGMNDLTAWIQAIAAKLGVTLPPITGT